MKKIAVFSMALLLLGMVVAANADVLLVYEVPGNSGTLGGTFTDVLGVFSGTDIPVTEIYSTSSPNNSGGVLDISSGNFELNFNTFLNFITIDNGTRTLLTGTFTGTPGISNVSGQFSTFNGSFIDTKPDTIVAAYFGFAPGDNFTGSITLDFTNTKLRLNTLDGSVHNYAPIPGSLLLMGSGLLGLFGIGIRRKSA
jgi:hypothetical protein